MIIEHASYTSSLHGSMNFAGFHLMVRKGQIMSKENSFSSILNSQKELLDIEKFYTNAGGNFFVSVCENKIVGMAGLKLVEDSSSGLIGEVKRVAVHPGFRLQGIATTLLSLLVEWASLNGFSKLKLSTGVNEKAERVYGRCGFVVVGYDEVYNDWLMELDLSNHSADGFASYD